MMVANGSEGQWNDDGSKERGPGGTLIWVTQLAQCCQCLSKNFCCPCTDDFSETVQYTLEYIFSSKLHYTE